MKKTLFQKLWDIHKIHDLDNGESLILIDRVFLHERTGSIALKGLEEDKRNVATPAHVFCTMDHIVDTTIGRNDNTLMPSGKDFIVATRQSALDAKIKLFDLDDPLQGIAHVVSPELGIALPGSTLVCPDSHTCTLGALGALAWGIGSTQAEHALVTNTLTVKQGKNMQVNFNGSLKPGVSAKDMILHLIAAYGANGGSGYVVEFSGDAVRSLEIEARMTLCNMAVEFSAITGLIAVDEKTIAYVKDRQFAPKGKQWEQAVTQWKTLHSDTDASFDKVININASDIDTTVTWGTSPQDAISINGVIPEPDSVKNLSRQQAMQKALQYMDLEPNTAMRDIKIDAAFIGSCTNSRLSDLRLAADYLKDKKISPWVSAVCVPGSSSVKHAAEAEGIDVIFKQAGFEWRESGCSMCFYAGGETFGPDKRVISSTNRNFQGRQGPRTRTHLASPLTVAASACTGYISAAEAN